tara:strand:- start:177 stop:764 length:588 start_codon:yes stop_codon:yes gene_type:complete
MDVFRNDKLIGYTNYYFEHNEYDMTVKNETKFEVEMFGVKIFSIDSKSIEKYKNQKLVSFNSKTLQNDKKKFVKLNYDKKKNIFIIKGSSYVGEADVDNAIGNWWSSKILKSNSQISPLSGSIKKQTIKLIGKDEMELNGKKFELFHFKLKSTDESLPNDKKLDFDIWLDPKKGIIFKVKYNRLGDWEYRIKNFN